MFSQYDQIESILEVIKRDRNTLSSVIDKIKILHKDTKALFEGMKIIDARIKVIENALIDHNILMKLETVKKEEAVN